MKKYNVKNGADLIIRGWERGINSMVYRSKDENKQSIDKVKRKLG